MLMRRPKHIPRTDLEQLTCDLHKRGSAMALPKNLPDRWLRAIARDLMEGDRHEKRNPGSNEGEEFVKSVVLCVLALRDEHFGDDAPIDENCLIKWITRYRTALLFEIIGRQTGVFDHEISLTTLFE